ncbi:PPC domain-containing DNA-binding protein [Halarchaeum salinum]|uniref:DNA-binding protein n=1 Tax=Halarchaeum salinum TaxID=489912 RepID=A0AAV3S4V2_9EURY
MDAREVTGEREFAVRFEHGAEWIAEIESFAAAADVEAGWFHATGAVEDAELAYYDQDAFAYETVRYDEPLEVASCTGTIALRDDEPAISAHVVLSRPSGQSVAGALERATVFDGELYCRTFDDYLTRDVDPAGGRALWE